MGRKAGLPVLFQREGSEFWWCRFTVNGKRYRISTGLRRIGEAEKEAQRLYAEAALGRGSLSRRRASPATATGPLEMLFAEYIVWSRANGKAESYLEKQEMHFRAHFSERWTKLAHITSQAIEQYKVERANPARTTSLYKELVTLSRFLHWCVKQGHLDAVPEFERIQPITDYVPLDLTPAQVRKLLAKLPDRASHPKHRAVREFFTVQWAQAMRPGEVMSLRWEDVDLRLRRLTIRPKNDKARSGRTIGLAPEAVKVLSELAKEKPAPSWPVFGRSKFRTSLRIAARKVDIDERITPHHLRHARLSELASATRDVAAVQYMAGHKNLSTTDRYVRSRTERTEEMLALLNSGTAKRSTVPESRKKRRAAN